MDPIPASSSTPASMTNSEKIIGKEKADTSSVKECTPIDYGSVPPEPDASDSNAVKISLKLANGKAILRRYLKTDLVQCLFAVAVEADSENAKKPFDLISRFPAVNLSTCLKKSIEEASIGGAQVFHRWI